MRDHQVVAEGVVAGGHRGVGREDALRCYGLERGVEGQSLREMLA